MAWLHAVIDVPAEVHARTADFWAGVLGWRVGGPWPDHPELCSFEPPAGRPYVHLQVIEGPARVHLDVESEDLEASADEALSLGATPVRRHGDWHTLLSPGGLPFCVVRAQAGDAPGAVSWPEGHRARLVQVCIDAPGAALDREVDFWRRLLQGRWVASSSAEFVGKWHDDAGSPLQLLFQRQEEPVGPVQAHLDHGTDDLRAEVRRVAGLGAQDVSAGHGGWHVLRDPAGLPFCVTANSPEQSSHRDLD